MSPQPGSPQPPRSALLAGASGLVGQALWPLLLGSPRYHAVHLLLRRPLLGLPISEKLSTHQVDFAHLPDTLPAVDDVYITLGTTLAVAGSQAAFRQVDHDAVVATARAARARGARHLAVVSALGANARSRSFYNRVKGEMQESLAALGYESLTIAQPSLLAGNRQQLGQATRSGEAWALRLFRPLAAWMPASIRPIEADAVAQALMQANLQARPGVNRLSSADMQPGRVNA